MSVVVGKEKRDFNIPIKLGQALSLWWSECPVGTSSISSYQQLQLNPHHRPLWSYFPPKLSAIVTNIKSQHNIKSLPRWRKRKLESDAIFKFANWSRFPFLSTAPLWPCLLYLKRHLSYQLLRRLPQFCTLVVLLSILVGTTQKKLQKKADINAIGQ